MSQGIHLRKYGVEATIDFDIYEVDGVDLRVDWVPAQADCEIMKDGGASTLCDNTATDEGSTYSVVLTATEMQFARGVLKIVDAATKVFLDKVVVIETYGNASAQHAFDLDTASVAQGADNNTILSSLTIASGAVDSNLKFIEGDATSGNNATLKLKQLDITNNAATAVIIASTGGGGDGASVTGNGTGHGITATGGATSGSGINAASGASGGQGIQAAAIGGNGAGASFQGKGSGAGLDLRAELTGSGMFARGGATSGAGILATAQANNDAGMELVKNGTGDDFDADTIATDTAAILVGTVTNAQGTDVATDVALLVGTDGKALISTDAQDLSGTLDVNTKTLTANAITAAAINADAITAAKIADDAIAAEHLATGAVVAATFAANAITSTVVADNTVTAAKLNADCITNAKIADDAIAAENLATGAIAADAVGATALDNIVVSDLALIPASAAKIVDAIAILFMALRNKATATSSAQTIGNDAGVTIATAVLSDAAGTTTKEEFA